MEDIEIAPRLAKMETAVQSVLPGGQPVQPVQDVVDLSGDVLRVLKDERLAPQHPTSRKVE
ncbi:MAG: hypothetical protein SFV18_15710 [Bryobacteraceae bacterium]|nr:hypothetical protein [Bryobacteraceae bacterium]